MFFPRRVTRTGASAAEARLKAEKALELRAAKKKRVVTDRKVTSKPIPTRGAFFHQGKASGRFKKPRG